jgi:glycosyltransferase involved in cell wall biosynthesis
MVLKLLVCGWTKIPHSYSIVNVYQIVHLIKNFGTDIKVYITERPYYNPEWNDKLCYSKLYPKWYTQILEGITEWNGQDIDIIYNITYPYDINSLSFNGKVIPKCVFYTSEFACLDVNYFSIVSDAKLISDTTIQNHLTSHKEIYFTCPSEWSKLGMKNYGIGDTRNVVITHGVDTDMYKRVSDSTRKKVREFYGVSPTDILLGNAGAMTKNKGIINILHTLHILVNKLGKTKYKLMLKGMGDLYKTQEFLKIYFSEMEKAGIIETDNQNETLLKHIIFINETLSYSGMNNIYNAIDLYLSPYIAEGFNLVPLEVIASGTRVLLPRTGSTREYSEIVQAHAQAHPQTQDGLILYVNSQVSEGTYKQNVINIQDILRVILSNENVLGVRVTKDKHSEIIKKINEHLSWDTVSEQLYKYLTQIHHDFNLV